MLRKKQNDIISVHGDLFGSKEAPSTPLYINLLSNTNIAKMLLEDYPNIEEVSAYFTLQDTTFTSKDYSLSLVVNLMRQLLIMKDDYNKTKTLHPTYKTDLHNFIMQKAGALTKQAAKIKSKKEFVRLCNILGNDLFALGSLFAEMVLEGGEENIKDGIEIGHLEIKLIKNVIAALEANPSKAIAQDKTKEIAKINITCADVYLGIGAIYFHDEQKDPLSSLFYLVKADEFLGYAHINGTELTYANQYLTKGLLCGLCIRSGDLEKAVFYAKSFSTCHLYLLKNAQRELSAMDERLKINPYTQLADAFHNAGQDAKAIAWYEQALKLENDANKRKIIQQNISKIATKYAALGQEAYKQGNYQEAIGYYVEAIKFETDIAIKNRYESIRKLVATKQKEKEDKLKAEIIELAKQFQHISIRVNEKYKSIVVESVNGSITFDFSTPLARLEVSFTEINSAAAAVKTAQAAMPSSSPLDQLADAASEAAEAKTVNVSHSVSTANIVTALEEKSSPSTEPSKERQYKSRKADKEAVHTDENNNNNNNAASATARPAGHPDEALGYALFGTTYQGEKIYPLTSAYIGKTVHFALFRPPTTKGLGTTLTQETIDAHRACLEKNTFGPKEGVRLTKKGMKTWISSNSQAGNIRFASSGEVTQKVNGVTYHLVIFDQVYDHKSQEALYRN